MSRLSKHDLGFLQKYGCVAGVDEAGRGSLVGPVVAAACIIPEGVIIRGINDSKKLPSEKRKKFFEILKKHPKVSYGIGLADIEEIETLNIYHASMLAMKRAISRLPSVPSLIITDAGVRLQYGDSHVERVLHADSRSQMVAAASIIAKEFRDELMRELASRFPHFGFEEHMGYTTPFHLEMLKKYGPTPIHRKGYRPVQVSS